MKSRRFIATLAAVALWLCAAVPAVASVQHTDTLLTVHGDRIILNYNVAQTSEGAKIIFTKDPVIRLGRRHSDLPIGDMTVWCFEKKLGHYGGKEKIELNLNNHIIKEISTTNANYIIPTSRAEDGYLPLDRDNELEFTGLGEVPHTDIPLFLLMQEKKQKYKIIDQTRGKFSVALNVHAPTKRVISGKNKNEDDHVEYIREAITEEREEPIPATIPESEMVNIADMISAAQKSLSYGSLDDTYNKLSELESKRSYATPAQKDEIDSLWSQYEKKKYKDEEKEKSKEEDQTLNDIDEKIKSARNLLNAGSDGTEAAITDLISLRSKATEEQQEQIDKLNEEWKASKNKRTIWMVIGGALLAILLFVGNHVLQSLRNRAQVRSMEELQQRAMRQAESKATQTVRRAVDRQVHKVERTVEKKVRQQVDRSKETLQQKAERAARGARINKHRDKDGKINV